MHNTSKELKLELFKAVRTARKNRLFRFILHPWKMLYPGLLRTCGISRKIETRTFWDGNMSIMFPELVSVNIWRYGYFEEDVCLFMLTYLKEGMTFMDIGAHFGFFTLLGSHLAGKAGRVFAFEPLAGTFNQLQKNIADHSSWPNIKAYNIAAYNEDTALKFYDFGLKYSAYNSITTIRMDKAVTAIKELTVAAKKIDSIIDKEEFKKIDMIKIDAESSEIHILEGLTQTLWLHKPHIILEVGDLSIKECQRSKETILFLQQMGYAPYEICNHNIVPHNIKESYGHANLLFINDKS
ncbi:MAG: FkbM family methyltransferase [Nitrospirota bacterium]|nr:FkbM family methyltransferase [Nitrospirota bacterium]